MSFRNHIYWIIIKLYDNVCGCNMLPKFVYQLITSKHTDYSDWQFTFAFWLYANFTCVLLYGRILWHMDTLVHNGFLSGSYLGKYKRDCNGTWFIDRWQWEEWQNTRTILLSYILLELTLLNFVHKCCLSVPHLGKYKRDWNKPGL